MIRVFRPAHLAGDQEPFVRRDGAYVRERAREPHALGRVSGAPATARESYRP